MVETTSKEALEAALALHRAGRLDEAEAAYRALLALTPDDPDALHFVGLIAHQKGRHGDAAALVTRAVALAPDRPTFHFNLGTVLMALRRTADAAAAFTEAARLAPDGAETWISLGTASGRLGRYGEAASAFTRAAALAPEAARAWSGLAAARRGERKPEEALAAAEQAVACDPALAEARLNLGNTLYDLGRLYEAEAAFHAAAGLASDNAEIPYNLGNLYQAWGRLADARAAYDRALVLAPAHAKAHANALLCRLYGADETEQSLYDAHCVWGDRHSTAPARPRRDASNRPLRIGYVSPDFRRHSCAYFIEPVLAAHDPAAVEVFCYASVGRPDAVTERLKAMAPHWRDIAGDDDATAADRVIADGIDILVDLAGHTDGNRLGIFARRPAPVQAAWLGYPATAGLAAIDWRLTDALADPPGDADRWHRETLYRLPRCFHCYRPPTDAPAVSALPGAGGAPVTFGSFNTLAKCGAEVVALWSAVLAALPGSRLVLKNRMLDADGARDHVAGLFADHGIGAERLVLRGWIAHDDGPLAAYHDIDIGLDPFPYNGTTTTCEALWMGVPVVTLRGHRHAARVGASLLGAIGRADWVAADAEDYKRIALALAADRDALADQRAGLRAVVSASPLRDEAGFARALEDAYRKMAGA